MDQQHMKIMQSIARECDRHTQLGYDADHDDSHVEGELAGAGATFALLAILPATARRSAEARQSLPAHLQEIYPFDGTPTLTSVSTDEQRISELVKGASLLVKEIARLQRRIDSRDQG